MSGGTPGARGRRRFTRRASARGAAPGRADSLQEALAELALLREENARLSAAAHEPASLGRLVARTRALAAGHHNGDDGEDGDTAAQMLIDGVVLRESLLEVCGELEHSIAAVKKRLDGIGLEVGLRSPAGGG
jgi:hypothetical protein